eukprot:gene13079-14347_t
MSNAGLMLSKWGRKLRKDLLSPRNKKKAELDISQRWNIVKGDFVEVTQGPQKGQRGKVLAIIRKNSRAIIEGVNMRPRTVINRLSGIPGKTIIRPCSIHYSNMMLIDPSDSKPTKIARRWTADGTKVRVSKRTGHIIPKPDFSTFRRPRTKALGQKDTPADEVVKVTFSEYAMYLPYIYARANIEGKSIEVINNDQK